MPINVEKMPDKREVPIGEAMRGLREEDLPALAQEIVEKCRYIPESKTSQVAKVLKKLYGLQASDAPFGKDFGAGATQSSTNRTSGGDSVLPAQLEDLLPSASVRNLDEYVEELYEEKMDMKIRGAQRLLRLCTEVRILDQLADHPTLLGVLSRELRENAKRSYELAVAITGIFLILANFSCFHLALKRHQCGEVTMRILEYESKRRNVLKNELVQTQEQLASSQLGDERTRLQHALGKCRARLERQDHLLQICLLVLRAVSEDTAQELKFVKQKLCQMLVPMLGRQHEDLLLSTLSMLHKLTIFEQNKDQLLKDEVFQRLAELLGHPASEVAFLAMRACYNLSFDPKGRAFLASQSNVVARLMAAATAPSARFKVVSLKLLYHLTLDPAARSALTSRHPTIASMALQLAQSKEQEKEALALLLNLAADQAAACLLLAEEAFVTVALRGIKGNQVILKVLRHIASHQASRSILLDVMGGGPDAPGSSHAWLLELVRLAQSTAADRHDVLVEAVGILAALDCNSPEVPWPELCEAGLLELLPRLLMVGFSEDDVVLEAVMLLSVLALDPPAAALLVNSKVIQLLPDVMAAKTKDVDLMVQLSFLLRCLIIADATRDAVLQTDAPARVLELLRSPEPAVQDAASELLEVVVAAETQAGQQSRWTRHIQEYRYKVHNSEWLDAEIDGQNARDGRDGRRQEHRSPSRDPSKRSPLAAPGQGWGESSDMEDRREEKRGRKKRAK
ncbi:KAP115 [Symbiodinium natans]|uniref:KAP115 protein n=1 Tax=Symbiodinium natans TaxID=878477 RepID=A0A812LW38_9DINO|nr:KAP115 [Symbiodinium natans]